MPGYIIKYIERSYFYIKQRYKLETLELKLNVWGEYDGSVEDALQYSNQYDHNGKEFTTTDQDHDNYATSLKIVKTPFGTALLLIAHIFHVTKMKPHC